MKWAASNLASWVHRATIEFHENYPAPYVLSVEAYGESRDYFFTLAAAKRAFAAHFKGDKRTKWTLAE